MGKLTVYGVIFTVFVSIISFNLNSRAIQTNKLLQKTFEIKQQQLDSLYIDLLKKIEEEQEDIDYEEEIILKESTRRVSGMNIFYTPSSEIEDKLFAFLVDGRLYFFNKSETRDFSMYFDVLGNNIISIRVHFLKHNPNIIIYDILKGGEKDE